jgi:hypothetical protein
MATDRFTHSFSDNFMFAKSKRLSAVTADTYNLIHIPRNAFVIDVWIEISTVFTLPSTVCVGYSGNGGAAVTNGFITTDVAKATELGLKRAMKDAMTTFDSKYFSSGSGVITATVTGTAGAFQVFAWYAVIH